MCTVSLIPPFGDRGLRVVVNRDERRTRPFAWPPRLVELEDATAVWPVDASGLGTWTAASSAGLAFVLMNQSDGHRAPVRPGLTTRGTIVPSVAAAANVDEACRRLGSLPLTRYAPFRLLVADAFETALCGWNGSRLLIERERPGAPKLFASSSLGDALVEPPRRRLFEDLLQREADRWRAQDRLHVHAWPDRRHLSVVMSRPGACTVSRTTIVVAERSAEMAYAPFVDGWPGPTSVVRLTRRAARAPRVA
jgi:hypothetical protein